MSYISPVNIVSLGLDKDLIPFYNIILSYISNLINVGPARPVKKKNEPGAHFKMNFKDSVD